MTDTLRSRLIALARSVTAHRPECNCDQCHMTAAALIAAARMALEDAAAAVVAGDGRIYTADMAGILAARNEYNARRIRALAAGLDNG